MSDFADFITFIVDSPHPSISRKLLSDSHWPARELNSLPAKQMMNKSCKHEKKHSKVPVYA